MTVETPAERRAPSEPGGELLARKGRASARGFGTATADPVAAEVARTADPPTAIELGRARSGAPVPVPTPRRRHALIADGDALSRKLYRDLLEAEGYDVVVAANGIEALQAACRRAPDIAVVNLRLAEPSGFEVARRLSDGDAPGGIPVVAVDEMYRPGDAADSRNAGIAAYLAKPISVRNFLDTVDRLMRPAGRLDTD